MTFDQEHRSIVALAGGVGGAKLSQGLVDRMPGDRLNVVVNTADDFDLWGLHISPDLDTVMYTLAGLANPATGWGIAGDTHTTLRALAKLGADPWFQLGDQDFATHILRSSRLREGATLTTVTREFGSALGIHASILPMTDDPVATLIDTPDGRLDFQEYFVARRQQDDVTGVIFQGIVTARPTERVVSAIRKAEVIVFCPSNPLVSIGPILALDGIRSLLMSSQAPRIAVSPLVGGRALKGPADRMLKSMGHEPTSTGIARIYAGLIDVLVIDEIDADEASRIEATGVAVHITGTVMGGREDRARLAGEVLELATALTSKRAGR